MQLLFKKGLNRFSHDLAEPAQMARATTHSHLQYQHISVVHSFELNYAERSAIYCSLKIVCFGGLIHAIFTLYIALCFQGK